MTCPEELARHNRPVLRSLASMEPAETIRPPNETSVAQSVATPRTARLRKRLRRPYLALRSLLQFLLLAWATLAIHYSNLPWPWTRPVLALTFAAFSIRALWLARSRKTLLAFAGAFCTVLIWFTAIPPSHNRAWRPDAATLPRAVIDGDRVRIDAVRNFTYRTRDDFTPRYEPREFSLARVASLDLFISYWQPGPIAHTFVSFNFDNCAHEPTPVTAVRVTQRRFEGNGYSRGTNVDDSHLLSAEFTSPAPSLCILKAFLRAPQFPPAAAASQTSESRANTHHATILHHALESPTFC